MQHIRLELSWSCWHHTKDGTMKDNYAGVLASFVSQLWQPSVLFASSVLGSALRWEAFILGGSNLYKAVCADSSSAPPIPKQTPLPH